MMTYVFLETSKTGLFSPSWYIYGVFSNEVDIWNCIEEKYYKCLNRYGADIKNVAIDRFGVTICFDTKGYDYIKYEIWKQQLTEG